MLLLSILTIVAPSAHANQPPKAVASAGVDPSTGQVLNSVTLFIGPADLGIPFTIAGGGSSDPDGDPLTYRWDCTDQATGNKCIFLFGVPTNQVNFRPTWPPGTFNITLTVDDGNFHTATDAVTVKVMVDMTPPTVTPPQDTTVSATEAGGARGGASADLHKFLFNSATATDNSTAVFTHLPPQVNGVNVDDNTLIPQGPAVVTFRIADNVGNVGMATAEVYVTDVQPGDVFVGSSRFVSPGSFGALFAGQVMLVRGGTASLFCTGPDTQADPLFFDANVQEVLVDSLGRVVFLGNMPSQAQSLPHHGLFRCDFPGDTPRLLGVYEGFGSRPASDPIQFPGEDFGQVGGLHLARTRAIVIQNGSAQIVNEDSYVFAAKRVDASTGTHLSLKSVRFRSLGGFSEDGPEPEQIHNNGGGLIPDMTNYKGDTYSAGFGVRLRRQSDPLHIHAEGSAFSVPFSLDIQLFGGIRVLDGGPTQGTFADLAANQILMDDVNKPDVPSGCPPPPIGVSPNTPGSFGFYVGFFTGGEIVVSPEQDFGLVATRATTGDWGVFFANVDQYLIDDDPDNDDCCRFTRPEIGCLVQRAVPARDLMPFVDPVTLTRNDPTRLVFGPQGLLGTQNSTGRVFRVSDSPSASGVHVLEDIVSSPVPGAFGIAAFPPQNVSPSGLVIVIQINSPVDVLVTDANGRRLGVDPSGTAMNDFAEKGHDTGAASHPRFYVIRGAQPGNFSVQSVGTGTGPFEIHIFGVNLDRTMGEHLLSSGTAAPGVMGKHDFTMDANGAIAFNNAAPIADAGADQMLAADASGNAVASLDGSASSDPDGDALSFTWAGPGVFASGAAVQLSLPVGIHVVTLTVDDGKGGTTEDTVTITVTGVADTTAPVLTLPANITVEATSAAGAMVSFAATANDSVEGSVPVTCAPPSGATFGLGTTTVDCSASDVAGNTANGSFSVTVQDTTPPALALPSNITTTASGPSGATVNFTATASDLVSGARAVNCVPASGSTFAVGTTAVNCSASDAAGNTAGGSFNVTVNPQPPPPPPSGSLLACSVASITRVNPGVWSVMVRFTNTSGGALSNVTLRSYSFQTLTGAGTVTHSWAFSPRLPYPIGTISNGSAVTLRWVLMVPTTVSSFSLKTDGTLSSGGSSGEFGCTVTVTPPQ